jgi:hypothetical protein
MGVHGSAKEVLEYGSPAFFPLIRTELELGKVGSIRSLVLTEPASILTPTIPTALTVPTLLFTETVTILTLAIAVCTAIH